MRPPHLGFYFALLMNYVFTVKFSCYREIAIDLANSNASLNASQKALSDYKQMILDEESALQVHISYIEFYLFFNRST